MVAGVYAGSNLFFTDGTGVFLADSGILIGDGSVAGAEFVCTGDGIFVVPPLTLELLAKIL